MLGSKQIMYYKISIIVRTSFSLYKRSLINVSIKDEDYNPEFQPYLFSKSLIEQIEYYQLGEFWLQLVKTPLNWLKQKGGVDSIGSWN